MTKLRFWFYRLNPQDRKAFITYMVDMCNVHRKTIYGYLDREAPKLTKHVLYSYYETNLTDASIKFSMEEMYNNAELK